MSPESEDDSGEKGTMAEWKPNETTSIVSKSKIGCHISPLLISPLVLFLLFSKRTRYGTTSTVTGLSQNSYFDSAATMPNTSGLFPILAATPTNFSAPIVSVGVKKINQLIRILN